MSLHQSPLQRHRAATQNCLEEKRRALSAAELEVLHEYLESFSSAASRVFGVSVAGYSESSPEQPRHEKISEQAWTLARAIEAKYPFVRAVQLGSGVEAPKEGAYQTLVSGAELLAELALGISCRSVQVAETENRKSSLPLVSEFSMLKHSVKVLAQEARTLTQTGAAPILFDSDELRRRAAQALRRERTERKEEKRRQERSPAFEKSSTKKSQIVTEALRRVRADPEARASAQRSASETAQKWHEVAVSSLLDLRQRFRVTLIASAAIALSGPAVALVGKLLGSDSQFWLAPVVVVLASGAVALAHMGTWRRLISRKVPARTLIPPAVPKTRNTPNYGSYVTKDRNFERRMGVTDASIFIPSVGRLMPLHEWIEELPKRFPEAKDIPLRFEFFRQKCVPGLASQTPLAESETEVSLPLKNFGTELPLHPSYEVTALSFRDRHGNIIASHGTQIGEGIFGSFEFAQQPPRAARSITFRLAPRSKTKIEPELIERIKKFLPVVMSPGTSELVELRGTMMALYPDDGERSGRWIAHLRSLGYLTTEDPRLSDLTHNLGPYWNAAFHAHRLGNCDYLATHAVAELLSIGAAAVRVAGITPDSGLKEFQGDGGHGQAQVLTSDGPRFFDLTIGAKKGGILDLSKLSQEERATVESDIPPESPEEALERGSLLRKSLSLHEESSQTNQRGHSFRDDVTTSADENNACALKYIARVLGLKAELEELASRKYEGFGEFLAQYSVMRVLYLKRPLLERPENLPAEQNPPEWPTPAGLVKAAISSALREPSLGSAERGAILRFAISRCLLESLKLPKFMLEQDPKKAMDALSKTLAKGSFTSKIVDLTKLEGSPFEVVQVTLPELYGAQDLLDMVPLSVVEDARVFNQVRSSFYGSALLWRCFSSLSASISFARGSTEPQAASCQEFPSAQSLLSVLEHVRSAFVAGGWELAASGDQEHLDRAAQAIMGINAFAYLRFPADPEKPSTKSVLDTIDEISFDLLKIIGERGKFLHGLAPLAILPSIAHADSSFAKLLALSSDYIRRQGSRFHGVVSSTETRMSMLPVFASAAISAVLQSRFAMEPYLSTWFSFLKAALPQSDPALYAQDESWILQNFEKTRSRGGAFPDSSHAPGALLVAYRMSEEAAIVDALEMLVRLGVLSPQVLGQMPRESALASAARIASSLNLRAADARLKLSLDNPEGSASPSRGDVVRIPWIMAAINELKGGTEPEISALARVSYALGGYDEQGQEAFIKFDAQHPIEGSALRSRLALAWKQGGFAPKVTQHSSHAGDEESRGQGKSSAHEQGETMQALGKAAVVANAFHGLDPREVHAALEWLQGLLISEGEDSFNKLQKKAEPVIEAVENQSSAKVAADSSRVRALLTEAELSAILKRFSLSPHPADIAISVPLAAALSPRAKVAALLLFIAYAEELRECKGEVFSPLSSALRVPSYLMRPLASEYKPSDVPLRTQVRLSSLQPDLCTSPIARSDLLGSESPGSHAKPSRRGMKAVRYRFPEFSDLVQRGIRMPAGEAGIYESARPYTPGMPAKLIDQRFLARTGKLFVRDRIEEIERPTILCVDIDSLAPIGWRDYGQVPPRAALAQKQPFRLLARELLALERFRQRSSLVVTSNGVPLVVFLSTNSRLKQYFISNPETEPLCQFVSGFTSPEVIEQVGRLFIASSVLKIAESGVPNSWKLSHSDAVLSWMRREPRGACVRVFDSQETLERNLAGLANCEQRFRRSGGYLEVVAFDPY
jgi:hypothetical protein